MYLMKLDVSCSILEPVAFILVNLRFVFLVNLRMITVTMILVYLV